MASPWRSAFPVVCTMPNGVSLARIRSTCQEWLEAVVAIRDIGIPIVALGGGGYNVECVIRMWSSACLTLNRQEVPEEFLDPELPTPRNIGWQQAEKAVGWL